MARAGPTGQRAPGVGRRRDRVESSLTRMPPPSCLEPVVCLTESYVRGPGGIPHERMAETEHIAVADVSDGTGGTGRPGTRVRLPVVELLTGRGFVTGKSGSGKSNTASVVAENLLDNGFGLLVVDIDGEYYGLKEAYEILHVGGDEECDIQVTAEHAEKLASLALEDNVPIILDVSSFLDEEEAEALLTEVSRHLFAKAKKQKQPFLMVVEEVHEYIPENGSVGECGKMLIKIGKRGRKHGLGICGISQRPADVKKDFITQCDWLVWHRLTWDNDTNVVRRVLDRTYADAVEDLDDGEAFLKTDWAGAVRRVQFDRKRTFDAGATPGLDDVERPELKSVSDDLVSELSEISEAQQAREDRIAELREELDEKRSRIAELEAELQDARDLRRMADEFVDALVEAVRGASPGRTEQERLRERRARREGTEDASSNETVGPDPEPASTADAQDRDGDGTMAFDAFDAFDDGVDSHANGHDDSRRNGHGTIATEADAPTGTRAGAAGGDGIGDATGGEPGTGADPSGTNGSTDDGAFGAALEALPDEPTETTPTATTPSDDRQPLESETDRTVSTDVDGAVERDATGRESGSNDSARKRRLDPDKPAFVRRLVRELRGLDERHRAMLAHYHRRGPSTPIGAHLESGGIEDRNTAYAHNRTLRKGGYIHHVGRGKYAHRLPAVLAERAEVDLEPSVHRSYVDWVVEKATPD
jgi:hypothetical protein